MVLTCLKQHQCQQQAGAHGQIAPALAYLGVRLPALRQRLAVLPSEPRCGVLNNPPGLPLRALYTQMPVMALRPSEVEHPLLRCP